MRYIVDEMDKDGSGLNEKWKNFTIDEDIILIAEPWDEVTPQAMN